MCVENHIEALRKKHKALGETIERLERSPGRCTLEISELKRKKLSLKQRIARHTGELTPSPKPKQSLPEAPADVPTESGATIHQLNPEFLQPSGCEEEAA